MAGAAGDESGEEERLSAEAAAFTLLETVEKQQETVQGLLLDVQTATRDLAIERSELGKVAVAIDLSHKGYRVAIEQAIGQFQGGLADADKKVSGYVVAALEQHQSVFAKALQQGAEQSIAQIQQVTQVAAKETLASLQQAARAGQGYAESAKQGVKAFRRRQWLTLFLAFLGGVAATMAGVVITLVLLDDAGRVARANQLEGRIQALQKQHDELQQEVDARRGAGTRSAPRPVR